MIPPPTPELAELALILGENDTREILRSFLRDTPQLLSDLALNTAGADEPSPCQLAAHSLKSTARLVGAHLLSDLAGALEARLIDAGPAFTPAELSAIRAEFDRARAVLAPFAA